MKKYSIEEKIDKTLSTLVIIGVVLVIILGIPIAVIETYKQTCFYKNKQECIFSYKIIDCEVKIVPDWLQDEKYFIFTLENGDKIIDKTVKEHKIGDDVCLEYK